MTSTNQTSPPPLHGLMRTWNSTANHLLSKAGKRSRSRHNQPESSKEPSFLTSNFLILASYLTSILATHRTSHNGPSMPFPKQPFPPARGEPAYPAAAATAKCHAPPHHRRPIT